VGINFAKALSRAWNVPIVAVNHMEGHILMSLAHTLPSPNPDTSPKSKVSGFEKLEFPALALLVSGGHTELVLIEAPPLPLDSASELQMKYRIVGETRDDAAGEAFDKCARLLGLPYPGGPEISRLATHARTAGRTKPHLILPRPMLKDGLEFSFSGLKTAVLRAVEGKALSYDETTAMAREIEDAIVEVLVTKTERAAEEFGAKTIIMSGGVSANEHLRAELTRRIPEVLPLGSILFPAPEFATDNAVMIALAGYFHAQRKEFADPTTLEANGNLRLA
jgi:N6-L-threonylcarbamoyladenine synthase